MVGGGGKINFRSVGNYTCQTHISFTILFFTLRHDKKQFKIQIVNQQKEHQENIGIMIKQHEQDLNKQTELNRIAIMPY